MDRRQLIVVLALLEIAGVLSGAPEAAIVGIVIAAALAWWIEGHPQDEPVAIQTNIVVPVATVRAVTSVGGY